MKRGRLCGEQSGNVDPYFKMPACSPDILMLAHVSKPTYVNIHGKVHYRVAAFLMSIMKGLNKRIYQVCIKNTIKALKINQYLSGPIFIRYQKEEPGMEW